jgi:hypothetical protein
VRSLVLPVLDLPALLLGLSLGFRVTIASGVSRLTLGPGELSPGILHRLGLGKAKFYVL